MHTWHKLRWNEKQLALTSILINQELGFDLKQYRSGILFHRQSLPFEEEISKALL